MAPSQFSNAVRSFWHSMTSDDRHATFDSPYRTNPHPGVGRNPGLQSVSAGGLSPLETGQAPYSDEPLSARSTSALGSTLPYSPRSSIGGGSGTPTSPYTPGMRSSTATRSLDGGTGEIPLQDFSADGSPPPPPVFHSWKRIDHWAEDNYPELFDQLGEHATVNDLNELENELDCSLPADVRESLQIHDGQERGGTPTGIIFSAMLLDCEEIIDEWKQWQTVLAQYLSEIPRPPLQMKSNQGPSSSGPRPSPTSFVKAHLQARQDSQPDRAVQKVYCHAGWIPLARDWGGNNIGVDLAPGPAGKWGQVIMFGRDFDCKYVIAPSWANFLATVADDLDGGHWYVDDESGELRLKELRTTKVEPSYLEILRMRTDRKYGRRPPPRGRRPMPPVGTQQQGPKGSRPGSVSPSSPMLRLSPIPNGESKSSSGEGKNGSGSGSGSGSSSSAPARSQSPIHAPTAKKPLSKVLEEQPPSPSSERTPTSAVTPSRSSMQSSRDENASTKSETLKADELSEKINSTIQAQAKKENVKGEGKSEPASKDLKQLDKGMEDVSLVDSK